MRAAKYLVILFLLGNLAANTPLPVHADIPLAGRAQATDLWGDLIPGTDTTFAVYRQTFRYGMEPFLITDIRPDDRYADKEAYEMHTLTIYRAHDGQAFLQHQPVIFYVHGGGWTDGYAAWYAFVANSFTGEKGWVTVIIDYRLTSDQVFIADEYCPDRVICEQPANVVQRTKAAWYPDNIADVAKAYDWVVANIAHYGGDPNAIFVFGHSAGGHLASLLATHPAHALQRGSITGVVSMSGAYLLTEMQQTFWGSAISQTFEEGFEDTQALLDASPATYVTATMALPPFYLLYAEDDLLNLTQQSLVFYSKLEQYGLPVEISYLPGYGHVSEMEAIGSIDETPTQLIIAWIAKLLRKRTYVPLIIR